VGVSRFITPPSGGLVERYECVNHIVTLMGLVWTTSRGRSRRDGWIAREGRRPTDDRVRGAVADDRTRTRPDRIARSNGGGGDGDVDDVDGVGRARRRGCEGGRTRANGADDDDDASDADDADDDASDAADASGRSGEWGKWWGRER